MIRPHQLCTYPKCDCLRGGGRTCAVADREDYENELAERELREKRCSICKRPESRLHECPAEDGTKCLGGNAYMLPPIIP